MNAFLLYTVMLAEKTLLASFFVLIFLYYLHRQDEGAVLMRNFVHATLIIRDILKDMYGYIVDIVHSMTKANYYGITYAIRDVATEQTTTATPQATETKDSNAPMVIVDTAVNCSDAPIVRNNEADEAKEIVPSSKYVQPQKVIKTNDHVDYTLPGESDIKKPLVNDNVIVPPAKMVQMKLVWIINSLSDYNIQTKCNEMKTIITDAYLPWISNLVMDQIKNESNFHTMYLKFLDCLSIKSLNLLIKADTVKNIQILLKRDMKKENSSFRALLNNLGHWLGMITLAKNKSIVPLIGDLDTLIVEAYNKGGEELLFTVQFIIQILESSANSKVFHAKSPWTLNILNCLAELHQKPALGLVLKINIEMICKKLNIELKDLQPSSMLRNPGLEKD